MSAQDRGAAIAAVIATVARGAPHRKVSGVNYMVGGSKVHVRWRTDGKSGGQVYSFNVNPTTLRADYELWVCGSAERHYLVPISVIAELHAHPSAYRDNHHPELTVVDIDLRTHRCLYARPQIDADFGKYFGATL